MADLEERLNASPQEGSDLEKTVDEESDWTFKNIFWDTVKYLPFAGLAYALAGPASLLTPIGLGIGKLITNKMKKKKTTWKEMRRTLAVGNWGGVLAYWAYSFPDFIIKTPLTLGAKIAKTLLFNPLMVAPWIGWYKTTNHIVQEHGCWEFAKSFFNLKIFKYAKEAYDAEIKGKYLANIAEAFLTLSPIHFFSMNYVANPTYRVGIGAINDVLVSLISGEEGLLKNIYKKFSDKKKEQPNPAAQPAYAPT